MVVSFFFLVVSLLVFFFLVVSVCIEDLTAVVLYAYTLPNEIAAKAIIQNSFFIFFEI